MTRLEGHIRLANQFRLVLAVFFTLYRLSCSSNRRALAFAMPRPFNSQGKQALIRM